MKKLYLVIFAILLFGIDDAIIAAIAATVIGTVGTAATSALTKQKKPDVPTPGQMPDVGEAQAPELGAQSQAEKRRRRGKSALTITRETGATGVTTARSTGATI